MRRFLHRQTRNSSIVSEVHAHRSEEIADTDSGSLAARAARTPATTSFCGGELAMHVSLIRHGTSIADVRRDETTRVLLDGGDAALATNKYSLVIHRNFEWRTVAPQWCLADRADALRVNSRSIHWSGVAHLNRVFLGELSCRMCSILRL